ncbi:hypothetical protein E2F46_01750 [Luteimonas aestuarii]|uniref:Transmembrane protein n=1 Tax=Luteimonas aestuarii TaxID=453837 RepID=A0A4R5U4E8_9GAMM|nr:hypothetical protein [Luteimonas aestuarii]TDK28630.1 hypothetical protein E2F46_01750 [Luteimonas aestuarii]
MHTIKVVLAGIALFAAMALLGRLADGASGATYAFYLFVPLWLACAVVNLRIGVVRAGYTVRQELPVLAVVFAVPVAIALGAWLLFFRD